MEEGLLSLRWNDHGQTFFRMLSSIRKNESFCDVTLACDGYFYPVHKFVLSTCSDFFYQMFEKTSCKHPVIVIANVGHKDLEALLNYMYLGEVNVLQTELTGLVKAAEILRIKGLAEHSKNSSSKETREKRTSLWETDQSEAKRRKNDDHSSVHRRQKESERVQHVKESTLRSRICDSDKHNHTNTENSETALDDTLDSVELSSGEMTNITKSDSVSAPKEHHLQDAVRPEVKIEEICVKEEPSGSWYHDDEKELDSYQYGDSEGGLGYEAHPTTFQENCSPWELAATQVQAMESQMTGIPGPSGIQGMMVGKGKQPRASAHAANLTARERAAQYPVQCYEDDGRLFCSACDKVLDHTRKSTIESHFRSKKHQKALKARKGRESSADPTHKLQRLLPKTV